MNLPEFLHHLSAAHRRDFRDRVLHRTGVSHSAWCQWASRATRPNPRHARCIVEISEDFRCPDTPDLTDHTLSLKDLRPHDL